jgi:transposase
MEKYPFLARYQRRTLRLSFKIIELLRKLCSIKSVALDTNVSVNTVSRLLDTLSYSTPNIPECISIDEFKGNTDAAKYQCILVDAKKHRILDILPDRTQKHLSSYFRELNRDRRHRVKFFVCDMWEPYVDLAKAYFPNAIIVIDKYHFIRYVTWAIEKVRKRIQKKMPANLRRYYKRSRKLILTRYNKLKDESKKACDLMLLYSDDLRTAHNLKEWFYEICQSDKYKGQREGFWKWVKAAEKSGIPEFEDCAKTYRNWSSGILNAFKYGYTNGPTEGYNNKIKVLKRVSFGIRNFERFRLRILHSST